MAPPDPNPSDESDADRGADGNESDRGGESERDSEAAETTADRAAPIEPWWTTPGIAARWDETRDTGPPKVILAKVVREGSIPALGGCLAAVAVGGSCAAYGVDTTTTASLSVGALASTFVFLYKTAGFRDSTLRGR